MSLPELPIGAVLPRVRAAFTGANRVIVQAPPGAGKSTLLPLALLDEPWLGGGKILMLEPRRLAARGVATWMAHLLDEPVGRTVGYRLRLDTKVSAMTRIEVVTEGVLTRMLQDDPTLEGAGLLLFDEFHERSLHADLGLALSLDVQATVRPDLRIGILSATLDTAMLSALLDDAPCVTAQGRSFPVEVRHDPTPAPGELETHVARVVRRALAEHDGDVLVFLPGAAEIRRAAGRLQAQEPGPNVDVHPLYGDLGYDAQQRAITPSPRGRRKVVLATAIAETSLTIEGITVVVDAGLSRRARFDPRTGMTRLTTGRLSRASAEQRRGRAGRLQPGVCYRLWSAATDAALEEFAPPEILEADLAPLALELAAWGSCDPARLRWPTPPPAAPYAQALTLLRGLGALDARDRITAHGRAMNRLGAHPRIAHMLIAARGLGRIDDACAVAALLEERDVLRTEPGARVTDLRVRLEALAGKAAPAPAGARFDRGALERARQLARNWRRALERLGREPPRTGTVDDADAAGILVALAYPDRIAHARGRGDGAYLLANGRGAGLDRSDPIARSEFLGIADLDLGDRDARVYAAAPLSRAALTAHFGALIESVEIIGWDARAQAVLARREERLGAILLAERAIERGDGAALVPAMIDGIRQLGIAALPWTGAARQWQQRVAFVRALGVPGVSEALPDASDAALTATFETWLAPFLTGVTRRADLARIDLDAALAAMLAYDLRRQLDALAPTHLAVPSGSSIRLDYGRGPAPVLAARLQELFGLRESPRVGGGRVPVLVEILSPASRPVQLTQDLAGFWARGYFEVRKELKGRYPRHYWPDDPATAVATRRVRPR
jgi:ATP-dependent helicase HrpB